MQIDSHLLTKQMFQPALPPRPLDAHKGTSGSVAVIGGDNGMLGAVLLASRAALLSGAGRVYTGMIAQSSPEVDMLYPELMIHKPDSIANLPHLNALVIGPGLGQSETALSLLTFWLKKEQTLVLDADALNLIAKYPHLLELIRTRQGYTILTPHPGEAARLMSSAIEAVQADRLSIAIELAQSMRVICVLKGAGTVIANREKQYWINTTGNPALSVGGTGDVLAGIIASLIAQGLSPLYATQLAVFVHGSAADALVSQGIGPIGLTASELSIEVRSQLNQLI